MVGSDRSGDGAWGEARDVLTVAARNAAASRQLKEELLASPRGYAWSNLLLCIRARGALDESAARAAWQEIVRRHDCFRTSLRREGEHVIQLVADEVEAPLTVQDLAGQTEGRRRARRVGRLLEQIVRQPLALTKAPMARAALVRLGPCESLLCWGIAHTIMDGVSWNLFTAEFILLYGGFAASERRLLPPPSFRLADLA